MPIFVAAQLIGAQIAKRIVDKITQKRLQAVVQALATPEVTEAFNTRDKHEAALIYVTC